MLTFEQMLVRLVVALALGFVLGIERELVHKEAGARTQMLVAGGASLFAMIAIVLPYITAAQMGGIPETGSLNAGLGIIANIVVGIGFLGAGIIIKQNNHPHGVTTAADVWATAAIGALAGIGLLDFATVSALLVALLLYVFRKMDFWEKLEKTDSKHTPPIVTSHAHSDHPSRHA